ncbi:MAG: S8 family serine peptidase [Vicingaceae bacterium]
MKLFLPILLVVSQFTFAQPRFQFKIQFLDKDSGYYSVVNPEGFLSSRAIKRRQRQGIEITQQDLPVCSTYIQGVKVIGNLEIRSISKWFNDMVIEVGDSSFIKKIRDLDYVESATLIPADYTKVAEIQFDKLVVKQGLNLEKGYEHFGSSFNQAHMLGCDYLHEIGNRGEGMLIAVIDAGFTAVPDHAFLGDLWIDKRIIATRDFVDKDDQVYAHSNHGMYVLTTLAAYLPGNMVGTAPKASYLLLRSEDGAAEYILEEYFWVEAAEFADSAGADVLNTSLGYTIFDDSIQDHALKDLDGNTTRISQAARISALKGMLVFNSAGNSGNNSWGKIGAPADAENIVAVGAVNALKEIATFSSRGPSSDGRIKPELCAMGNDVVIGNPDGTARSSNGTSFSSPVLSGMAACLWQSNPDATWQEIRNALIASADRHFNPDTNYGYGIPNAILAESILKKNPLVAEGEGNWIQLSPNPFSDKLIGTYSSSENAKMNITFIDMTGRKVNESEQWIRASEGGFFCIRANDLPGSTGTYIVEFRIGNNTQRLKVVKR